MKRILETTFLFEDLKVKKNQKWKSSFGIRLEKEVSGTYDQIKVQ